MFLRDSKRRYEFVADAGGIWDTILFDSLLILFDSLVVAKGDIMFTPARRGKDSVLIEFLSAPRRYPFDLNVVGRGNIVLWDHFVVVVVGVLLHEQDVETAIILTEP